MSAKPEAAADAAAPAKSKKMLVIVVGLVVVLVLVGGGVFFFLSKRAAASDEEGGEAPAPKPAAHAVAPGTPPAYLPLDSMVVNLADPGGERVAQIGVTLEVTDAHSVDAVKAYLPSIRSGILLLVAQRTAEELLKPEGKEKLAKDILREATVPFGGGDDDEEDSPPKKKKSKRAVHAEYPVIGVLFSSFIVQ